MCNGVLAGSGTWGMVLVVVGKKVRVVPVFEENKLGNDGLVSVTSALRNVTVWILTKAVSSSTSQHRKGGNIIGNSHTDLSRTYYMWPTSLAFLMRWDEQHWGRGETEGVLARGKANLVGLQDLHRSLCQRSRAAAAAAAHEALVAWRPCSAEKPRRGARSLVTSRSHIGHICALLPKHEDFMSFWGLKAVCCFWTRLGVYSTVETLQHSEICCLLLFSWALIAAARSEELVKGYDCVHSYILFTLLELLIRSNLLISLGVLVGCAVRCSTLLNIDFWT